MEIANMIGFIIRILGNSIAIYAAYITVPGFIVNGGIKEYLLAGILLGILNLLVRPVLKMISMPLIVLSLGLFGLVINAIILWIVDYMFDFVLIENLVALFWAVIIITLINLIISLFTKII